jgi:hypothetical protein
LFYQIPNLEVFGRGDLGPHLPCSEHQVIGGEMFRSLNQGTLSLNPPNRNPESASDLGGQFVLDYKNVLQALVVLAGPDVAAGARVDELGGDA